MNGDERKRKRSARLKLAVGATLSLLFLYLAVRNVEIGKIPGNLRRVDYPLFAFSLLVTLATFFVKALQVRVMLGFPRPVSPLRLAPLVVIGYYFNNIFPLKAGEVVRSSLVARKGGLSFWTVFSALVVERGLDIAIVLCLSLGLSFFVKLPPEVLVSIRGFVVFLILLCAGLVALAALARRNGRPQPPLVRLLPRRVRDRVMPAVEKIADGLLCVRSPARLAGAVAGGLCLWGLTFLVYHVRLLAFGVPSSPALLCFTIVVVGLGVSIPSAPSYVGVYHWLIVFSFGFFGLSREKAFSFALVTHAVDFLFMALAGNLSLLWEGLSLRALKKSAEAGATAARPPGTTGQGCEESSTTTSTSTSTLDKKDARSHE